MEEASSPLPEETFGELSQNEFSYKFENTDFSETDDYNSDVSEELEDDEAVCFPVDEQPVEPQVCSVYSTMSEEDRKLFKALTECLETNMKMRAKLMKVEENLEDLLDKSSKEMLRLSKLHVPSKPPSESTISIKGYGQFATPYFKTIKGIPCPRMQDFRSKVESGELISYVVPKKRWKVRDLKAFEASLRNCLVDFLVERSTTSTREELKKYVYQTALSTILKDHADKEFDWMQISASLPPDCDFSPTECRAVWNLYLKPSLNHAKWSTSESHTLIQLAREHNEQDWESIASKLETRRSPLQCIMQYQTQLRAKHSPANWNKEEDERLKKIVERCTYGSYISWPKVVYFMEGKSFIQVYTRYKNSLCPSLKRGKFSLEEDAAIIKAVYKDKLPVATIATMLGNRNPAQVRYRIQTTAITVSETKSGEWSVSEDNKLVRLVREHGESKWSQIAKDFKTRTRTQVRHRYGVLKKYKFDLEAIPRWKRCYPKSRQEANRKLISSVTDPSKLRLIMGRRRKKKRNPYIRKADRVQNKVILNKVSSLISQEIDVENVVEVAERIEALIITSCPVASIPEICNRILKDSDLFALHPGATLLLSRRRSGRRKTRTASVDDYSIDYDELLVKGTDKLKYIPKAFMGIISILRKYEEDLGISVKCDAADETSSSSEDEVDQDT